MKRKHLRDQLSKNPYWIPAHKKEWMSEAVQHVLAFDLNLHQWGCQPVADVNPAYMEYVSTVKRDPRRVPLFAIVHALLQRCGEGDSA